MHSIIFALLPSTSVDVLLMALSFARDDATRWAYLALALTMLSAVQRARTKDVAKEVQSRFLSRCSDDAFPISCVLFQGYLVQSRTC